MVATNIQQNYWSYMDVDGIVYHFLVWLQFCIYNVKGTFYFYLLSRCPPLRAFVFQKSDFIATTVVRSSYSILNENLSPFSLSLFWYFCAAHVLLPSWPFFLCSLYLPLPSQRERWGGRGSPPHLSLFFPPRYLPLHVSSSAPLVLSFCSSYPPAYSTLPHNLLIAPPTSHVLHSHFNHVFLFCLL